MVRFYLCVEPLLRSVRTYDPGVEHQRTAILDRIEELVVKPRTGFGGHGVVVGPHAEAGDVRAAARALLERPEDFVAREMVMLSTHPTAVNGRLDPRHVDLLVGRPEQLALFEAPVRAGEVRARDAAEAA